MKWLGGHPGRKQSRRIRSVGHAPKLSHYSPRTGMPELGSVLLRRLHEFVVHDGQTWSSIVLNLTVPSLSRRRPSPITSTKKSFRLHQSSVVRRGKTAARAAAVNPTINNSGDSFERELLFEKLRDSQATDTSCVEREEGILSAARGLSSSAPTKIESASSQETVAILGAFAPCVKLRARCRGVRADRGNRLDKIISERSSMSQRGELCADFADPIRTQSRS